MITKNGFTEISAGALALLKTMELQVKKLAVCHLCGIPVKRAPFAVQGESRCVSGACLDCCNRNHNHPRGN